MKKYILWFDQIGINDVLLVGGKNASLGEMISNLSNKGILVPNGFATTAHAYREFLAQKNLGDRIRASLDGLNTEDVTALAVKAAEIRSWIIDTPFQPEFGRAIETAFNKIISSDFEMKFAIRSSATAEDLPNASFAGQQETFLNISGHP